MKISLKQLRIKNFKGIQDLTIVFNQLTNIYGENATGKTTIFDAFLWLFFSKNSKGVNQFEIKRLDSSNNFIKNVETEVLALIDVEGEEIEIKKVLRQKWVKRRGQLESEYNGDENVFFWNDVPLKETDFKVKVKGIIDENLFRLITNPFYFNTLNWQERRNMLVDIAGNVNSEDLIKSLVPSNKLLNFDELLKALNQKKSVDDFKKEIAVKKKKIKDESELIPSRIDEVKRGLPEEQDYDSLTKVLSDLNDVLIIVEDSLYNESERLKVFNINKTNAIKEYNQNLQDQQAKIYDIKSKMQQIELNAKQEALGNSQSLQSEITQLKANIELKQGQLSSFEKALQSFKNEIVVKQSIIQELRDNYDNEEAKELLFDDKLFTCPACNQPLSASDVNAKKEEVKQNFNKNKASVLTSLSKKGRELREEIDNLDTRIKNGDNALAALEKENQQLIKDLDVKESQLQEQKPVDEIQTELLGNNLQYSQLLKELGYLKNNVIEAPLFNEEIIDSTLQDQKTNVVARIKDLEKSLSSQEVYKKGINRIAELEKMQQEMSTELMKLEEVEFSIMQFIKAKVEAIEQKINNKFKYVQFKMFNVQVNGGEVECCDTLINGVPFADANNAAKINAGIDIINTLCDHYEAYAPVFVDNAESITNIRDIKSQLVCMYVSAEDKKLRIS